MKNNKIGIVVTTEHRGVFFGYVPAETDLTQKILRLEQCRMCVYWPQSQHGVVGLAAKGPTSGSKITPAAAAIVLQGVIAVMECSDDAIKKWEDEPWK